MEPSEQSRAKIALGKADKAVHWTISAAHRFARDMMRRVAQEDGAFYVAGNSIFTDILLIIALLLAFILIFLLGYCFGSRCGRRAVNNAAKAVICDGGCQVTAACKKQVIANGGKQDDSLPAANGGVDQFTDKNEAIKQQSAYDDSKKQSADDDDGSAVWPASCNTIHSTELNRSIVV